MLFLRRYLLKFLLKSRLCDCYEFLSKTAVSELAFLVSCYYGKVLGTESEDTTTRTDAAASSKAEQAEPAKENSLPTNPNSKQGEEFQKEALLENVHAAPPPIAMTSHA